MTEVQVRRAGVHDLSALSVVDERVSSGSERWSHVLDLVTTRRGFCLVSKDVDAAEITGYVVVSRRSFFGRNFVELLHVGGGWRRQGIGVHLLAAAVQESETSTVFTSTNESNSPMRRLLDRDGWSVSGVLDGLDEGDPEVVYYRSAASEPCTEPITQH